MMTPHEFLQTIYFGDRACKSILLDGWNNRVVVQVDVISRVRSPSGNWEFYTDEDVADANLVFAGVRSLTLDPAGAIPNDAIEDIQVRSEELTSTGTPLFLFELSILSGDEMGTSIPVRVVLQAESLHLEDPRRPGIALP